MENTLLYQSIFPILQYEGAETISIAGTSVLVEHRGLPFLVTAAHILRDNGRTNPLYLSLENNNIELHGPAVMTPEPLQDNDDDLDIAIFDLRIHRDLADALIGCKSFPLEDINEKPFCEREHLFIFGFPWRKAFYNKSDNLINIKPLKYITDVEDGDELYREYNRPKINHLIIHYDKYRTITKTGERVRPPNPLGISGGPLFKVLVDKNNVAFMLILEGILTTWITNQAIIATRKSSLRKYINDTINC